MGSYIIIIVADILLAVGFVLQKEYQNNAGASMRSGLVYNLFTGIFTVAAFYLISGFRISFSWYSFLMASGMFIFNFAYLLTGFKIMKYGNMSMYTIFLMAGGMLVPYIWGVAFLGEKVSMLRIIGCIVIVVAIFISDFDKNQKIDKKIWLCIAVFFMNGAVSVISKMHQINDVYKTVSSENFVFWSAAARTIVCGVSMLILKPRKTENVANLFCGKNWMIFFASAVVGGVSYVCQLNGAVNIPATVLYPLITGGTVILSVVADRIVFKTKLTKQQYIGTAMCFVGTCLFL